MHCDRRPAHCQPERVKMSEAQTKDRWQLGKHWVIELEMIPPSHSCLLDLAPVATRHIILAVRDLALPSMLHDLWLRFTASCTSCRACISMSWR